MTVPAGLAREQYAGSGSTGPFAFNHKTFVTSHLTVTRTVAGVDTLLVLNTDYTVVLAADFTSAAVTLISALAVGQSLTVLLDPPIEQIISYSDNDPFPAATHERALDLACMELQALAEKVGRTLVLPVSSLLTGLELPSPTALAFLQWNALGDGLQNAFVASPGVIVVSPFMTTVLDDPDAATARATLGALGLIGGVLTGPLQVTTIEVGAAADTTLSRSSAGNLAVEGKVIKKAGKETIWIPAISLVPRSGSPAVGVLDVTNTRTPVIAFDPAVFESAVFTIGMPKSWDLGSFSYQVLWAHPATTVNFAVLWGLEAFSTGDNEAIATGYTGGASITDTGGVTNNLYVSPESATFAATGAAAAGDLINFQLSRNAAAGGDTLAVDAFLIGIRVFFTTNAGSDD